MTKSFGMAPTGVHQRNVFAGTDSVVQNKWQLLKIVEDIRELLKLKGTSIALLRAMLSFIRSDEISADRDEAHICFASNNALARRTHVSVQTVERHIAKMVDLGLVIRKISGNGKRWARRDKQGNIVLATGLSLLPLIQRHAEFQEMAHLHETHMRNMSLLRDKCSIALARLKNADHCSSNYEALSARARKVFRRKPDDKALQSLLFDITEELNRENNSGPDKMMDSDPKNEGHKETILNPSVEKEERSASNKLENKQVEQAYPILCKELRVVRTHDACQRRMNEIAQEIRLGNTWWKVRALGSTWSFMILGYILERLDTIETPSAYAHSLVKRIEYGNLDKTSLLTRPSKSPIEERLVSTKRKRE